MEPRSREVVVGDGRTRVSVILRFQGQDLLLQITGGRSHVGAVAVCDCRRGQDKIQTGERTIQLPGHREGPLAVEAAETLAAATQRTCAAVVGIHQDSATPDEIQQIVANVRQGLQQLVDTLDQGTGEEDG